jgi:hypothetical protein
MPSSVLVADDHAVRDALVSLLQQQPVIETIEGPALTHRPIAASVLP